MDIFFRNVNSVIRPSIIIKISFNIKTQSIEIVNRQCYEGLM